MSAESFIELFAENLKRDLQDNLKEKLLAKSKGGFSGDSRLGASIRIVYTTEGTLLTGFELWLNDYYQWVDEGRQPGNVSREGQQSIAMWVKSRQLVGQASTRSKKQVKSLKNKKVKKAVKQVNFEKLVQRIVYPIVKKITKFGYKGNFFFSEVVNDGRLDKFKQRLSEAYGQEIQIVLNEVTK